MLTDRSIVTFEDVRLYLGLGIADRDNQTALESFIDTVSGRFESDTENVVMKQAKEEFLHGSGTFYQDVGYFPTSALVGVAGPPDTRLANLQYRDTYDGAWRNLITAYTALWLNAKEPYRLTLVDGTTFPQMTQGKVGAFPNIRVYHYAGYTTRDLVPGSIRKVILEGVAWMWRESGLAPGGGLLNVNSKGDASSGVTANTSYRDFEVHWETVVSQHRKLVP